MYHGDAEIDGRADPFCRIVDSRTQAGRGGERAGDNGRLCGGIVGNHDLTGRSGPRAEAQADLRG